MSKKALDQWVEDNGLEPLAADIDIHLDYASRENMVRMIMMSVRQAVRGRSFKDD